MQSSITRYNYDYIEKINSNFKGELDENVILNLMNIKTNLNNINAVPIKLKYKMVNNWDKKITESNPLKDFEIKVNSLLNKLTNNNFKQVLAKIVQIIEFDEVYYTKIIDIFFEKALEESIYSNLYAKLLGNFLEENDVLVKYNKKILEKCELFYNENSKIKINRLTKDMKNNEVCELNKKRTYILGGYIFIANLYNYNMISYNKIIAYIQELINFCYTCDKHENSIYIDSIINIVNNCGNKLKNTNPLEFKKIILSKVVKLKADTDQIDSKYKFKLLDLIEQYSK
tara:strand:- start:1323 stop:2180 length:858 start_codon:yes stop_codon:yes gene_type:complete